MVASRKAPNTLISVLARYPRGAVEDDRTAPFPILNPASSASRQPTAPGIAPSWCVVTDEASTERVTMQKQKKERRGIGVQNVVLDSVSLKKQI
jgi:hypothetical protein